ncbi:MAG: FAD-binding protein, partial [Odoribacter sp.]|nr:FAD-binding protein [Odoribacter sp.]
GLNINRLKHIDYIRRSVDARRSTVLINLLLGVHVDEVEEKEKVFHPVYKDVSSAKQVIIVGTGPAGLFAALRLIEKDFCSVVLERGKSVEERKKDLQQLYRTGIVNEDSNFGFGEGGAGTFSDGKLYTRSKKRGNVRRALEILVWHGADENILVDSHPHIGTDRLPGIIVNIRKTIEKYGGKVLFGHRITDLLIENNRIEGVIANNQVYSSRHVILATGHSARDIYRLLNDKGVLMEPKGFAVGLRLEHPQKDIDCIQYHSVEGRGKYLPAAEYNFTANIEGKGVYSFCICPGGIVVPAATGPNQQVVNGMSSSARNTPWANSAIVTVVGEEELTKMKYRGLFAGMEFQEFLEREAYKQGGGFLKAPGQTATDFLVNKFSNFLPKSSYKFGVTSTLMSEWMPPILNERLKRGLIEFGKKSPGFITEKAVLIGVETRTSAPLRIPRDKESREHPQVKGLYPCGEGAGYAGGIISAALDGENCVEGIN